MRSSRTTTCCAPPRPDPAMPAAAAAARMRFLGLTPPNSAPTASERPGVKRSSAAIHFGSGASSPGFGRLRNPRHARKSSTTPSAIFTRATIVRGPLESAESAASVATSATPPTTASAEQPAAQERRTVRPRLRRGQDEDHGDDRQRADGDADRQREHLTDRAAHGPPPVAGVRSAEAAREPHCMRPRHSLRRAGVTPLESHRVHPADSQQIPRLQRYNCVATRGPSRRRSGRHRS